MGDLSGYQGLLDRYAAAWAANDPALLAACWDADDPAPLYKAEEIAEPFTGMAAVRGYWEHNRSFNEAVRLGFSGLSAKPLAPGLALLVFQMRWDIRFSADARLPDGSPFASRGKTMGGDNHVAAIVADTETGPKFRAWIEAPDAPIAYVRRLYEDNYRA